MSGFPKDDIGFYLTPSIIKGFCNADSVQVYSIEIDLKQVVMPFHWEKNRNRFDFLIDGEEIQFSNFRLGNFGKFKEFVARLSPQMKLIG